MFQLLVGLSLRLLLALVGIPAEEVELHLLVVGAYIGVERASDAVGHALDIGSFARFQRIFLFLAQFHPFQLLRDDDFALSALALPLLHLAVQSPEVVIEAALAYIVLEACVVMLLPPLGPHALDQYGLAVHQAESLVFGQRYAVDFTYLLHILHGEVVQAVGLGIEGQKTGLHRTVRLADVNGSSGVIRFQQVVLHFLGQFRSHVLLQIRIPFAAFDVEYGFSVGRFHQPDAGRCFKADALEVGADVKHGRFMPVEQACRTDFAQRFGRDAHACELLPVHLLHAPLRGLLRGGFFGGGSLPQVLFPHVLFRV